jgi:hypothetical protein
MKTINKNHSGVNSSKPYNLRRDYIRSKKNLTSFFAVHTTPQNQVNNSQEVTMEIQKEVTPYIQNHDVLREVIDMKVKNAMKERYPTAEEIVGGL